MCGNSRFRCQVLRSRRAPRILTRALSQPLAEIRTHTVSSLFPGITGTTSDAAPAGVPDSPFCPFLLCFMSGAQTLGYLTSITHHNLGSLGLTILELTILVN